MILEATYEAGITLDRGVAMAGDATEEPTGVAARAIAGGESLASALTGTGVFGSDDLAQIDTGEQAGDLSATLRGIAQEANRNADAMFKRSMMALAKGVYFLIMLTIGLFIVLFYMQYVARLL